jgi:glycosyltransferase involved in cell wall biosynthesis
MHKPLLSVLIDTYNHEKYIEQAVVSAIEQDFPAGDYEILVVDDGSRDRTPEIVRKFAPRVRLLSKKNGGQASAFNVGVHECRGEVIAFLDGDDWFAAGKLAAAMKALDEHPEAAAASHGFYVFDEEKRETQLWSPGQEEFVDLSSAEAAARTLQRWPFLLMGGLTARRQAVERAMPVPERLTFCADSPIALGCAVGGVWILAEPLCYYRHHSDNLHSGDPRRFRAMQRRFEVKQLMYADVERMLLRLGVNRDIIAALLYESWVHDGRIGLSAFGGSRLTTFRAEMRSFAIECESPTTAYRCFKYLVVGGATLLLPARTFYRARRWYSRWNLGRLRERFTGTK